MYRSHSLWFFLSLVCSFFGAMHAEAANELRIETEVFVGSADHPVSRTTTLFDGSTVYDFVEGSPDIAVFRPATKTRIGQFVLLNTETHQRTELSTERLNTLIDKLTKWAKAQEDAMLRFSAEPEFEEAFDQASGELVLTSPLWNYTVATVPAEDKEMLKHYREFTDWYSRLNTLMHSTPPPGPRLWLNKSLVEHGVVPVEIRRSVNFSSTELRATHLFAWRLSREDRTRLEAARRYLTSFEKVGNEAFLAERGQKPLVRGQLE